MRVERIEDTGPVSNNPFAATSGAAVRDPASFARTLRTELRAAQAEALGITTSGDGDGGAAGDASATRGGSALSSLIDSLQRDLLGLGTAPASGAARLSGFDSGSVAKPDPNGWRALARSAGDSAVGAGFGALFERQIDQESGFNPDVVLGRRVSSAGAEGIAQLMPEFYPNVDRLNPREALGVAANTMATYISRYDGDVRKALAAYNAGPGRVGRLIEEHGSDWEAYLPSETKGYLERIAGTSTPRLTGGSLEGGPAPARLRPPVAGELTTDYDAGHPALDIAAPMGAAIRASAAGRVVSAERRDDGYGWNVVIDHGGGMETLYAHASAIYVRPGDTVGEGDVIAAVGSTGRSTGPHVHYEVRLNGVAADPLPYIT